jgi:hypothetical protein
MTVEVTDETTHDAVDHCPYAGMTVTGWPTTVLSRGEVIVDHGELLAERGRGRFLPRAAGEAAKPAGLLVPRWTRRATSVRSCSIEPRRAGSMLPRAGLGADGGTVWLSFRWSGPNQPGGGRGPGGPTGRDAWLEVARWRSPPL